MVGNFPDSATKSSPASGARAATYTSAETFGSVPVSLMTVPPHEWATSTVGPSCIASTRRVSATESSTEVSGFCTAVTCKPAACSRGITSLQLEPSAQAPCTNTTLRACTGADVCALTGHVVSANESALTATTVHSFTVLIDQSPSQTYI